MKTAINDAGYWTTKALKLWRTSAGLRVGSGGQHSFVFVLIAGLLVAAGCNPSGDVRVQGSGVVPALGFACCDQGIEQAQRLFAQPGVLEQLRALHATVAIPTADFSQQRAALVRQLGARGIPVVAWIVLSADDGYYLNAANVAQAAARLADFEQWTRANGLRWAAVGLDIEPNFGELARLSRQPWRLAAVLARRSAGIGSIRRARQDYADLIRRVQGWGYPVQIYEMPYVPAERAADSTLADRLLGTPQLRGDQNYTMLYTSFARPAGAGVIRLLGQRAWGIAIGSTSGPGTAGVGMGPLDWEEFSDDLLVASHFTRHIGIYNLEGCVHQGFLPRLVTLDWGRTVVIPAAAMRRAKLHISLFRSAMWVGSNLLWLIAAFMILCWLLWRVRRRRKLPRAGGA
ncbi:MAG TPA: hypothetical protein VHX60_06825 [Acidobacteriaceae bacterium]|nr:hypothetical protein [Acidobacteriaceae bacterium]